MVFGPEVEVVESSQDGNVVLDILVLPELVQTSVLATQQIDDYLVALLPSERAVDNQDCSKL